MIPLNPKLFSLVKIWALKECIVSNLPMLQKFQEAKANKINLILMMQSEEVIQIDKKTSSFQF
jgi:hypothetical protein